MLHERKSYQALDKIYFWTATIHEWHKVLDCDENKKMIIDTLRSYSNAKLITVYGFVIMPTHIHIIWKQNIRNGQEMPLSSFMKYTAKKLLIYAEEHGIANLFKIRACNKVHQIWKRDSLAIELFSRKVMQQKLNYIHTNPIKGKWQLASDETSYQYSSAKFYEAGIDDFDLLNDVFIEFDGH